MSWTVARTSLSIPSTWSRRDASLRQPHFSFPVRAEREYRRPRTSGPPGSFHRHGNAAGFPCPREGQSATGSHAMPLIAPILDDRSFEDLFAELRNRIPVYNPAWTDHLDSDPGITLLQLFAYLGEGLAVPLQPGSRGDADRLPQAARHLPLLAGPSGAGAGALREQGRQRRQSSTAGDQVKAGKVLFTLTQDATDLAARLRRRSARLQLCSATSRPRRHDKSARPISSTDSNRELGAAVQGERRRGQAGSRCGPAGGALRGE
jgi:hypothetical protein